MKKLLKIKKCNGRINKEKYEGGKKKMNKKLKIKQERGITLIALVVTIIIMLILAGVSIKLAIDNNGVIENAKEAKDQYEQAQADEDSNLNELSSEMKKYLNANKNNSSSGTTIEGVTVPAGYYYVGGTKAKGIVISDNANDNELDKGKEDVRRDLAGNQWVWVPVETPSSLYTTVDEGVALRGSTGVTTKKYTKSEIVNGIDRGLPGEVNNYREPDIVTDYDNDTNAKKAGFSSLANMAETMVSEYDEMIRSIEKYKGFYIGRYELTANGEKTGATQTGITWYEHYKNCKTLAVGSKVKTRMIWGLQWDATCNWLARSGFDITDSTTWGNYSTNEQNTGYSESWKANNIYDFTGNYPEFTQEALGAFSYRTPRGGYRSDNGSSYPASHRYFVYPTLTNSFIGTRPTLYLIP